LEGNVVVTGDLILPALNTNLAAMNTTLAAMNTTMAAVKSTLESIQFNSSHSQQNIDFAFSRLDSLETTVASLVESLGASVIPPWRNLTDIEQGDDEPAAGGGPAIPSAAELGLIIQLIFPGQGPVDGADVLDINPRPGTVVKRGSTVVVNLNG